MRHSTRGSWGLGLALILGVLAPDALAQGPGSVRSVAKISRARGGFGTGLDNSDQFGRAVTVLGDLDGNGVPDIAVGTHSDDDGGRDRGAVWVLFLREDGSVLSKTKISDTAGGFLGELSNGDQFGRAVSAFGDLDGDGISELAVGSVFDDDVGSNRGATWVLFLNADGSVRTHQKISQAQGNFTGQLDNGDQFGRAFGEIGDLNRDGVVDLAVGASYDDDGDQNAGAVWILFLNANGTVASHQKISATSGNFGGFLSRVDYFGHSVAGLGDFDADGNADLVVGAVLDDASGCFNCGSVWLVYLNSDGTVKDERRLGVNGSGFLGQLDERDQFGVSVARLGDVNGDGVTDIAVGAVKDDDGAENAGAIWILMLNANGSVLSHQKISKTEGNFLLTLEAFDWLGSSLSYLGDFDGDGVPDLLSGARWDDDGGMDSGAMYLLFLQGDPGPGEPAPVPDFTAQPQAGTAPLEVAFQDASVGVVSSWSWTFGDGNGSTLPNPTHTYVSAGTYDVGLLVSGPGGSASLGRTGFVVVDGTLAANFTADPLAGAPPLEVSFQDLSGPGVTTWSWDFGDGTQSSAASPLHTYLADGTYSVQLTVRAAGGSATILRSDLITVSSEVPEVSYFGCGVNPVGSLLLLDGAPVLGTTMTFAVDNPLGSQNPGSTARLLVCTQPDALYPCGTIRSNLGMGGDGEFLVNPATQVGFFSGDSWAGAGQPANVLLVIPNQPAFVGLTIYAQGVMTDLTPGAPLRNGLAEAVEFQLRLPQ